MHTREKLPNQFLYMLFQLLLNINLLNPSQPEIQSLEIFFLLNESH